VERTNGLEDMAGRMYWDVGADDRDDVARLLDLPRDCNSLVRHAGT
jgi:hypothetical protein